jgi:hypothetical protein
VQIMFTVNGFVLSGASAAMAHAVENPLLE